MLFISTLPFFTFPWPWYRGMWIFFTYGAFAQYCSSFVPVCPWLQRLLVILQFYSQLHRAFLRKQGQSRSNFFCNCWSVLLRKSYSFWQSWKTFLTLLLMWCFCLNKFIVAFTVIYQPNNNYVWNIIALFNISTLSGSSFSVDCLTWLYLVNLTVFSWWFMFMKQAIIVSIIYIFSISFFKSQHDTQVGTCKNQTKTFNTSSYIVSIIEFK